MTTIQRKQATITDAAVDDLRTRIQGQVLAPADEGYDEARAVWNGMIDRRPGLIARCTGAADVSQALRLAREKDLPLTVRAGGHGVAGHAVRDGTLMIDLTPMKGVWVDPQRRIVRAQAGLLLGELDRETQAHGLAVPSGVVTHTGVAGLTLGGGIGWLMRKHGLSVDNIISFDVVTADGELLTASAEQNSDLFWGLRGGGGNFAIVTSFEFAAHQAGPEVLAGAIVHPAEDGSEVLRFYRDFIAEAPDELGTIVNLRHAPAAPFLPESVHGQAAVMIAACYNGPIADGERVLKPLREYGRPLADIIQPTPFTAFQGLFDATVPHGNRYYFKAENLGPLTDEAIGALTAHAWRAPSPKSYTVMFHMGGAVRRVDESTAAFQGRQAEHALNINGEWTDPAGDDEEIAWVRNFWTDVQPYSTGVYVNFLGDEGEDRIRAAYGPDKYDRLVQLKRKYDPDNVFNSNQNVSPAG